MRLSSGFDPRLESLLERLRSNTRSSFSCCFPSFGEAFRHGWASETEMMDEVSEGGGSGLGRPILRKLMLWEFPPCGW